jgi:hypothetical protein
MVRLSLIAVIAALYAMTSSPLLARSQYKLKDARYQSGAAGQVLMSANHDVGRIGVSIGNDGTLGNLSAGGRTNDWFTGEDLYQGEYPLGNGTTYFWGGALWIGAIVGRDTLVSTGSDGWSRQGNELQPDFYENGGGITYRSTLDPGIPAFEGALSEQDFIAVYRDTCINCYGVSRDAVDNRGHRPLNIEVTQRSMAWSYPAADDIILLDYAIKNIGTQPIEKVYVGLYMDHDVHDLASTYYSGALDDFVGMWSGSFAASRGTSCETALEIDMPWIADNDGDLNQVPQVYKPVPHVSGVRLLDLAGGDPQTTFNWWVSNGNPALDWGPMRRVNVRDFGTGGSGTPEGDRNKYYLLSNGDRDYDMMMAGTISSFDSIWLPPPANNDPHWEIGFDARYLASGGGFDLEPGQTVPFTVAFVCGENLHTSGSNWYNLPDNPDAYVDGLDFRDFLSNGLMAGWIYDNPGVDTDGDGSAGSYQLCGEDTLWYQGDGVPDWCASTPPSAPAAWVEPRENGLYVRWNGFRCENQLDWATREPLFEGYRVYLSTDSTPGGFASIGSYDVEDYYRYYWDFKGSDWKRSVGRLTLEEARCRYAPDGCTDVVWHPLDYTRQAPFVMSGYPDSLLYFLPIMANSSQFGLETPFLKRFPEAPRPSYGSPSDVPPDSVAFYLTDDGYFKYYEYEMTIDGLMPGLPYWVGVTSFGYGSMVPGASPLESSAAANALMARPSGVCCEGIVGNADCDEQGNITLVDIAVLIDFRFINGTPLCCLAEADVNQSGGAEPTPADVTLADIMTLIDYLFITGTSLGLPTCQ